MVSRREEIGLVGLIGGALIANYVYGPTAILPGGLIGLLLMAIFHKTRWIR